MRAAKGTVGTKLVELGNFSFRYRGYMLPVAVILLLIPSPRLTADPADAGLVGFLLAVVGQVARIVTIGLAYIIRGGKDHKVYAEDLVTSGLYSHVRNPMYVGATVALLGAALYYTSLPLALYAAGFLLAMSVFVLAYEEPVLRETFGEDYARYCREVGRSWPRRRARPVDPTAPE